MIRDINGVVIIMVLPKVPLAKHFLMTDYQIK